jgi:hypothetical protein
MLVMFLLCAGIPNNTRASSGGGDGFDLNEVMDYVGKALSSGNADVRAAALRVAVAVAGCAAGGGAAVRRLLPKDLNPKLREQADAALGGNMNGAAAPAAGEVCINVFGSGCKPGFGSSKLLQKCPCSGQRAQP